MVGFKPTEGNLHSYPKQSPEDEERRWLKRLATTIETLDVSRAGRFDARVELLNNALLAIAKLVNALSTVERRRNPISTETLEVARKVLTAGEKRPNER